MRCYFLLLFAFVCVFSQNYPFQTNSFAASNKCTDITDCWTIVNDTAYQAFQWILQRSDGDPLFVLLEVNSIWRLDSGNSDVLTSVFYRDVSLKKEEKKHLNVENLHLKTFLNNDNCDDLKTCAPMLQKANQDAMNFINRNGFLPKSVDNAFLTLNGKAISFVMLFYTGPN